MKEIINDFNSIDRNIERDFKDFQGILEHKVFKVSDSHILEDLKIIHKSLCISKMLSNDLFYNSEDTITPRLLLNQHLLISSIVLALFGDNYTSYFLLRGSLENIMKCILLEDGIKPVNKFSNNLEKFMKIEKNKIFENINSIRPKKAIRKSFNKFVSRGREDIYGNFSDLIHIRTDNLSSYASHLNEFFNYNNLNVADFDIFKNYFLLTLDYESMLYLLNTTALKEGKFSVEKIEYFRKYCEDDYKEVLNLVIKYL